MLETISLINHVVYLLLCTLGAQTVDGYDYLYIDYFEYFNITTKYSNLLSHLLLIHRAVLIIKNVILFSTTVM